MMLAMARHLCKRLPMHAGKVEKKSLQGTELRAKTLVVWAWEKLVGKLPVAPGLSVWKFWAHDPFVLPQLPKRTGHRMATLDEVYAAADTSTAMSLDSTTTGMINADSIKKMRKACDW